MKIQLLTNPHIFTYHLAYQHLRNRDVAALCFPFPRTWHFPLGTFCLFYCDGYQYETKPVAQGGRGYAELLFFPTAEGYVKALYKDDLNEQEPADFQYVYIYKDHLGNNRLSYTLDPQTEQVKILEENHYYPFGLKHSAYNLAKLEVKYKEELAEKKEVKQVMADEVAFKYKYNGKELQDELGLNWYDYGFRNYDAALGRWMSIDNLAEQYTAYSPYYYAGNNPIFNFDIDGNEFTEGAEKEAGKLAKKAGNRIDKLSSKICKLQERIGNTDDKDKIKSLRKEIKGLQSKISRFENVISEINELRDSDVLYDVQLSDEPLGEREDGKLAVGETTYENGKVVMTVYDSKDGASNLTSYIAHEFKHAFQFEKGYFDFDKKTGKGGLLWKVNRSGAEYQAYSRQKLFSRGYHIPKEFKDIPLHKAVPSTMNKHYKKYGGNNEYIYRHNKTTITWKR